MNLWNFLSILPIFIIYLAFPLYSIFSLQNITFPIQLIFGTLITDYTTYLIKKLTTFFPQPWNQRPKNACDCSFLNDGGPVGGQPGFPSGHSATVGFGAFTLTPFLIKQFPQYHTLIIAITVLITIGTLIARYMKSCHNLIQIVGGFTLGIVFATLFHHLIPTDQSPPLLTVSS